MIRTRMEKRTDEVTQYTFLDECVSGSSKHIKHSTLEDFPALQVFV